MTTRRKLIWLAGILSVGTGAALWFALRPTNDGDALIEKHDPIEDDPYYRPMLEAADREAREEVSRDKEPSRLGSVHGFWRVKKRILKEKYGVDWRTPAEMNPKRWYD